MIQGINANVEHQGTIYHVQTEVYGGDSAYVHTHVFVGGAIKASKKTCVGDAEPLALARLQHRVAIRALRTDRLGVLERLVLPTRPAPAPSSTPQSADSATRGASVPREVTPSASVSLEREADGCGLTPALRRVGISIAVLLGRDRADESTICVARELQRRLLAWLRGESKSVTEALDIYRRCTEALDGEGVAVESMTRPARDHAAPRHEVYAIAP